MKKIIFYFVAFLFAGTLAFNNAHAQNVNVNPGAGTYPTLKAAFDAINAGTHTGAVTVDIVASTVEPLMAILNASGAGSASYTSVVITTSVGGVTVAGSDTATIKLAGADNVTLDGRIAGTGRNISVTNSNILANSTAVWLAHGGYAATDSAGARLNVIRNCEISCGVAQNTATTSTFGIFAGGTTRNSQGRNNDSNQYRENRIIKSRIGIRLSGGVATSRSDGNVIYGNIIGPTSFGTDQIGATGILTDFQNDCLISKNTVQFVGGNFANTTGGADRVGIGVGTAAWSNTSTTTTTNSAYVVTENIIHDIIEERTFSAVGILVGTTLSGPKTNNLIANNVIYNVRANGTAGDAAAGIGSSGGPGDRIVFNSISLTGDLDPAGGPTTASSNPAATGIAKHLASAPDTAVFISDNSILVDCNTNTATLLKAAIVGPAVGYGWGSGGLNNNDYWVPNFLNGNITGITGTGITPTYTTLANWQAAYTPAQDGASIQSDPLYASNTSNLQPGLGSPLVGAGAPVAGITTDILGITRSVTTPTIGAYETAADVSGPTISYALLANTTSTSNRTLNPVTITDPSGVNGTSGTSPRVYYKKSTDPNTSAGWVYTEATGTSPFSFTINYALLSGGSVSVSDVIQYFVVAQDLQATPLVGINSGTFNAQPSSVALTAGAFPITGTINSYIIVGAPLAGDYTIGALAFNRFTGKNITFERVVKKVMREVTESAEFDNVNKSETSVNTSLSYYNGKKVMREVDEVSFVPMENGKVYDGPLYSKREDNSNLPSDAGVGVYATITAAVNDLNARGVSGPVRFLLKDATYSTGETFPITINTITGGSSINTLTIQPDSAASTITGSSALALLKLNGADYVTVDGLNTGGKSLTFNNTNTGGVNVWIASASVSDGATNNTMKNLSSIGPSVAGILSGSGTILGNDAEAPNSNNTITGCTTKGTQNGLYLRGNTTTVDQNWSVTLNNCGSTVAAEKHTFRGMGIVNCQNFTISNNNIAGLISTTSSTSPITGIGTYISTTGGTIEANKIDDIFHQNVGTYGAYGIDLSGANNITVKNNFISNMRHDMSGGVAFSTTFGVFGIRIGSGTGHMIYYNSVNLYGTLPGTPNSSLLSAALCIVSTTSTGCDIRNNILKDSITGGTTSIAHVSAYMPTGGTSAMNLIWNNNAYYNGSDALSQGVAQVGTTAGTGFYLTSNFNPGAITPSTNFRAYSSTLSATGNNDSASFASYNEAPFISNTDLHIQSSNINSNDLNGKAAVIAGVTTDIDGNPRNPTTPDIGADEFTSASILTLKLNWEACPNSSSVTVELRNSSSPYAVVESVSGTAGGNVNSNISFTTAANGTPYYVVVKSANSIETWSATTVTFTSGAASFDFTTALSQAYGSNQKLSGGIPSIYQGDSNQDGFANATDVLNTYNNASAFITTPATDFNCDGITDLSDVILAFNNNTNFVQKQTP